MYCNIHCKGHERISKAIYVNIYKFQKAPKRKRKNHQLHLIVHSRSRVSSRVSLKVQLTAKRSAVEVEHICLTNSHQLAPLLHCLSRPQDLV